MKHEKHTPKHDRPAVDDASVKRGFELTDVRAKTVTLAGVALSAGLMVAGLLLSWVLYTVFKSYAPVPEAPPKTFVVPDTTALPPVPRLQANPHIVLVPFVRSQDSILASYGWVSRDSGIVHIPIERAMELVVKQGLPVERK
ncbi:MAG TPA: hypothetical protein VNL69_12195 [Bacteroidota bacterium]|nr:hypothetical protein [Bacteroidota bacterium]